MELDELYRRGLKLREETFGEAAVERRMKAFGEFGAPLQTIINAYVYGDIWQRPELSAKLRSLVMIGITAALGRPQELRVHVEGALANGWKAEEIREVLLLVAMYCGVPAGIEAHRVALDAIQAREQAAGKEPA
jgi:4-carboxymuconolactone decarboxylase